MPSIEGSYPAIIARCQHIKINGTQCGCPALRDRRLCFFHHKWQEATNACNANAARRRVEACNFHIPILEDANAVQVALMEVMRMLLYQEIGHKTAALLLYALQTASSNLHHTNFDPRPEQVLTDATQLAAAVIGGDAWSKQGLNARLRKEKRKAAENAAHPNASPATEPGEEVDAGKGNGRATPQNPPEASIDLKASAEQNPESYLGELVDRLGAPLIAHVAMSGIRPRPNRHHPAGVKSKVARIRA
jgi:hypothetical protein